jgi:DNA-binding NtrC family response regulator
MIRYFIYIIDDEKTITDGITMALEGDLRIKSFSRAEPAIEALRQIKSSNPDILVIMITAYEDVSTVISAMKLGAYDYVIKPLHMDGLEVTIRNALDTIRLRKEVQALQEKYLVDNVPCFIGESNAIQDVMDFIKMVAKSPDTPILLLGETGTGKELIASTIHYYSPNFKAPFATLNCAAIPKDLIESELFGYEKGAFSGADTAGKKGLIEEAAGGTLFLDEVGDLSLEAQAKLLRFLELGEFYRVGGTKKIKIQTRIISATNKNLALMLDEGLFRKDLYFRLGVIKVQVPSLNVRPGDIVLLAKYFLQEFGKKFTAISPRAESALLAHNWIGNVRELKNLIERAVLIGNEPELTEKELGLNRLDLDEELTKIDIKQQLPPFPADGLDLPEKLQSFEKYYIQTALKMAKGNESQAARLLHMNHHTFRYRKKKLLGY